MTKSQPPASPIPHGTPHRPKDVFRCLHTKALKIGRKMFCASCNHQWEAE